MALSLSSIIKWILCLIGGLPLLQILAHTFGDLPIPFAKGGKFPPESIKRIVEKIKKEIEEAKQGIKLWQNRIKEEINKNFTLPADIKAGLEKLEEKLRGIDDKLAEACPALFSKTGEVATFRDKLMAKIGSINSYAEEKTFLGKNLRQWSEIGADGSFAAATIAYRGHASEIAGVLSDDEVLVLEPIPGYPLVGYGSANVGSNTINVNLNYSRYPITDIGSTIKVANTDYIVVGKNYDVTASYINVSANSVVVYSKNVETFNLAETYLSNTSDLTVQPGMWIRIDGVTARVNTINALGDYLTVYPPRIGYGAFPTANSNTILYVETGIRANTNIIETGANVTIKLQTFNQANSECLSDIISGNGTSFLTYFSANDSVYFDEKEFTIVSLTNSDIVIDDKLRFLENQIVYKIARRVSVQRTAEGNGPDSILASFSVADQMAAGLGDNFMQGMTTRYKKADGTTARIDAWKPVHVTTAIQPAKSVLLNRGVEILQDLFDNLRDDVINELTDNELTNYIEDKIQEIEDLRKEMIDTIEQDLAAIKSVKALIAGLLKLFKISCSKKKKGDDPEDPDLSSDEYLDLIIMPNPERQGCSATQSDLIDLLDEADDEYNTVELPDPNTTSPLRPEVDENSLVALDPAIYGYNIPGQSGGNADVEIDQTPDSLFPDRKDPCVEPC